MTAGYFVPGTQEMMEIEFPAKFPGYLWVFPRADHMSVGICGPLLGEPASAMRQRLEEFMQRRGLPREAWPLSSRWWSLGLPSFSPAVGRLRVRSNLSRAWNISQDGA